MAPLSRVLFLAAIVVVAMAVLSPSPAHGRRDDSKCYHLNKCNIENCRSMYQRNGFPNPVVTCGNTPPGTILDTCCCMNNAARKLA
ncbi:hypothetical protein PVAP13_6KG069800 [Panicum virgatum]|uniref:Uncharacterized protein n=1 Tax=Panicum virgatum TaxID=38727 RepID=A0A8T0R916_PANVG|nr:hypothetical protein PVAP13_6KG069800 [Panicum virgatum]